MLKIESVKRISNNQVGVSISIPEEVFKLHKINGTLNNLYTLDISSEIHHLTGLNTYKPQVYAKDRSKKGMKPIEIIYEDSQWGDNVIYVDFKTRKRIANVG